MSKGRAALVGLALLALPGCTRTEDYLEVARAQQEALRDVTAVLTHIHSEKDMAAAKEKLDDGEARFEAIARKARALPKPPPEVASRLQDEAPKMQRALEQLRDEVQRVRGLPGGQEFLKQYQGRTGLFSAPAP